MNKKGNIIIITLFITLIIGIIGIIVTKYLLNLIEISSENYKYYKAYYVAYAGIELELGKIKYHGMGFSDFVDKNSLTVSENIAGINYYFSSSLYSTGKYITSNHKSLINDNINCSNIENYISLGTGQALMLPLIYDQNNGEGNFSGLNYNVLNISPNNFNINYIGDIIVSFQSNDNKLNQSIMSNSKSNKNLQNIFPSFSFSSLTLSSKPFLVFAANKPSNLCIDHNNTIVAPYSYIISQGNFMDRSVQLNVIKNHKWANFTVYGIY